MNKNPSLTALFIIVIVNFIAQIPYYFYLYSTPPSITGSLLLLIALIWFVAAFILLRRKKLIGYILMVAFLLVEFLFYLSTQITQALSGSNILLYVIYPSDPLLFIIFGIGYLNMVVAAFYTVYLFTSRKTFLK